MMVTNLFSTFDPSTSSNMALNWLSLIIPTLMMPLNFWVKKTRTEKINKLIMKTLHNEFKALMSWTLTTGATSFIIMTFWFLTINNLMGLMPYIFTATSHMSITLTLALPIWLSLMIFGWLNNTNKMFSHLLPSGTPPMLMMFMILIETISNIIRPITLSIRLSANMIAGHLLLTLLGNQGSIYNMKNNILIINTQFLLLILELAVAIIQGYVFIILISLYTTEIH